MKKNLIISFKITAAVLLICFVAPLIISCGNHVHEWSEWETFVASTCDVVGQERSTCSCGEVRYRTLPKAHEFEFSKNDITNKKKIYVCRLCGAEEAEELTYEDLGVPIVSFSGSLSKISTKDRVTVDVKYESPTITFTSKASIKIQGSTSATYEKKNYSVKLMDEDGDKFRVKILDGWGEHSKYCLKANYIDYSQARNVVSAKLYGQIAKTRDKDDIISTLTNGGAIDGFPAVLYINGKFNGIYTFNTPKDEYIFGIEGNTGRQAVIMAGKYTHPTELREAIPEKFADSGFEIEYCSTEDDPAIGTSWVRDSFNEMIAFINHNDGFAFKEGISEYIDVDRAIDEMLFTCAIAASDNTAKNILWVTYDGKLWIPSPYDLDSTWGLYWNGKQYNEPGIIMPNRRSNVLWERLSSNYQEELAARWQELRAGVLSIANIRKAFEDFLSLIPDELRDAEKNLWKSVPNQESNNIDQIMSYANDNLYLIDSYFGLN
ncbi:MAG: CotH kinase family protein [Clostridia bacterium]|nr:CotH kinase family protein [Clostridia bacterium]